MSSDRRRRALYDARSGALLEAPPSLVPTDLEVRVVPSGQIEVQVDDDSTSGTFAGWGIRWNVTDSYGTRFRQGCFAAALDSDPYAFLWMHDPWTVLGSFAAEERDEGLWIEGTYDPTPEGQTGRARARSRSASELSIGFRRARTNPDDETEITEATLLEVSQITARMASSPGAALADARATAEATKALETRRRITAARLRLAGTLTTRSAAR